MVSETIILPLNDTYAIWQTRKESNLDLWGQNPRSYH